MGKVSSLGNDWWLFVKDSSCHYGSNLLTKICLICNNVSPPSAKFYLYSICCLASHNNASPSKAFPPFHTAVSIITLIRNSDPSYTKIVTPLYRTHPPLTESNWRVTRPKWVWRLSKQRKFIVNSWQNRWGQYEESMHRVFFRVFLLLWTFLHEVRVYWGGVDATYMQEVVLKRGGGAVVFGGGRMSCKVNPNIMFTHKTTWTTIFFIGHTIHGSLWHKTTLQRIPWSRIHHSRIGQLIANRILRAAKEYFGVFETVTTIRTSSIFARGIKVGR